MHSLALFHRIAGRRIVVLGEGDMAEAKRRLVERAGGIPCSETEAHHARLAFVALDNSQLAESAALRLRRLGLLVNVADRPELCDFTLPSIVEREPVLIAVSTGGASAGLAKHLRLRLEAILPQSIGMLASALEAARERLRIRWSDAAARRQALDKALEEGGTLDVLGAESHTRVDDWLESEIDTEEGQTFDFTMKSDDPEDLTLKQARLLGRADYVLHDPDVAEAILIRARADARRIRLPSPTPSGGLSVILRRSN